MTAAGRVTTFNCNRLTRYLYNRPARCLGVEMCGVVTCLLLGNPALASGAANSGEPTNVTLALDCFPNETHAGLYSAVYEGFFADEGLEVATIAPPPGTGLALLGTDRVDFAMEGLSGL